MSAAIIFGLLIALMLTGMPVSIALGMTVLTFLFTMTQVPIESVGLKLFTGLDNFSIMALPFFILAGTFLTHGGVAKRMIKFTTSLCGHWHGGLGLAAVTASALFAAVSGSSVATVVAIGSIMLPAMVSHGYPKSFGAGVITTSGALGILVPPSVILVLYGVSTNTSIGALFMAGVLPGIMLAVILAGLTCIIAWRKGYPRMKRASWGERFRAFRESFWGLALIGIVLGGIYGGVFTPTEAAAVAAVYAFVISVFVYRDMGLKDVPKVLLNAANTSAMLLYIITNAVLFSFLLTSENIPQEHGRLDRGAAFRPVGVPAGGEFRAAGGRQRDGADIDPADHGADPVPDRHQPEDQPDPSGHPDGGEHGSGAVPPADRAEPVCCVRHRQDGDHRADQGGLALAAGDAGLPGDHHLRAVGVAVPAAGAGDVASPASNVAASLSIQAASSGPSGTSMR